MAEPPQPARVIGIDGFFQHFGHSYNCIVVDLERRQAIDLLPDRQYRTDGVVFGCCCWLLVAG